MSIKSVELTPDGQGTRIRIELKSGYVIVRYVEDTSAVRVQEIANQLIREFRQRKENPR